MDYQNHLSNPQQRINGRQIRNALMTAIEVASYREKDLSPCDISDFIRSANDFEPSQ